MERLLKDTGGKLVKNLPPQQNNSPLGGGNPFRIQSRKYARGAGFRYYRDLELMERLLKDTGGKLVKNLPPQQNNSRWGGNPFRIQSRKYARGAGFRYYRDLELMERLLKDTG